MKFERCKILVKPAAEEAFSTLDPYVLEVPADDPTEREKARLTKIGDQYYKLVTLEKDDRVAFSTKDVIETTIDEQKHLIIADFYIRADIKTKDKVDFF
jgi:hypothetical protein